MRNIAVEWRPWLSRKSRKPKATIASKAVGKALEAVNSPLAKHTLPNGKVRKFPLFDLGKSLH